MSNHAAKTPVPDVTNPEVVRLLSSRPAVVEVAPYLLGDLLDEVPRLNGHVHSVTVARNGYCVRIYWSGSVRTR